MDASFPDYKPWSLLTNASLRTLAASKFKKSQQAASHSPIYMMNVFVLFTMTSLWITRIHSSCKVQ